jgi:hypothetical protein
MSDSYVVSIISEVVRGAVWWDAGPLPDGLPAIDKISQRQGVCQLDSIIAGKAPMHCEELDPWQEGQTRAAQSKGPFFVNQSLCVEAKPEHATIEWWSSALIRDGPTLVLTLVLLVF